MSAERAVLLPFHRFLVLDDPLFCLKVADDQAGAVAPGKEWSMRLPQGIDLDQYKTQAKELLKQLRAAQPEALHRLQQHHPEQKTLSQDRIQLADAQLLLARENGFPSWTKLRDYLVFRKAVEALDAGNLTQLEKLLAQYPSLIRYQCRVGKGYEQGYFAGATLLYHVANNPPRAPFPPNILDITKSLLRHGAGKNKAQLKYTLGLLLTSLPASKAGVALPLIDILLETGGVELDWTAPDILDSPLGEGAYETAKALLKRGARMRLKHAAMLGRLDLVRLIVAGGNSLKAEPALPPLSETPGEAKVEMEEAFLCACEAGATHVAAFLLDQGINPISQVNSGQTGLHYAAHSGHLETVEMLLARDTPLEVRNMYGATVLGQTVWSALHEPQKAHIRILECLMEAGANRNAVTYPTGDARIDEVLRKEIPQAE
ncbi:MAG: ankyrin repeat domain-containing protein [Armatimonas sp.]